MRESIEGIRVKKDQESHHIGIDEQRMKNKRDQVRDPPQDGRSSNPAVAGSGYRYVTHSSFLSLATGMFSCSRYFATVRRAILYPFSWRSSVSFSSLSGFFLL